MKTGAEQLDWLVGLPVGIRTRVCFDSPSGAHPLTPEHIRQRYIAQIRNSALVVWHLPDAGIGGVRAGIDEVAWHDADIVCFETSFCRPAKGSGHVFLSAERRSGQPLAILSSDQHDSAIHDWHCTAAALLERAYPGLIHIRDDGYDA
jgi:hypothetical protein